MPWPSPVLVLVELPVLLVLVTAEFEPSPDIRDDMALDISIPPYFQFDQGP
jgi:hypothetical protein